MESRYLTVDYLYGFLYLMSVAKNKLITDSELSYDGELNSEHFERIVEVSNNMKKRNTSREALSSETIKRAFRLAQRLEDAKNQKKIGRPQRKTLNEIASFCLDKPDFTFSRFCINNKEDIDELAIKLATDHSWRLHYFDLHFNNTSTSKNKLEVLKIDEKIEDFKEVYYQYYYYDDYYDEGKKFLNSGISLGLIKLWEPKYISIKDKAPMADSNLNYQGEFKESPDRKIIMELKSKGGTSNRDLHVIFDRTNMAEWPKLMMGQYHNIDGKSSPVSGTLIALLQPNNVSMELFQPKFLCPKDEEYEEIPRQIRRYLKEKAFNRIKTPPGVNSLLKLGKFLDDRDNFRESNKANFSGKVFISTPTTCLDEKNYPEHRRAISELKDFLFKKYNCDCYAAICNFESYKEFKKSNILLEEVEYNLNNCDLFIMILGEALGEKVTSSFIELGYALQRGLNITIFIHSKHDKNSLPNLLVGAIHSKSNKVIDEYFENFNEIIETIRINGLELFGVKP